MQWRTLTAHAVMPFFPLLVTTHGAAAQAAEPSIPAWQSAWRHQIVDISILAVALVFLTLVFFFQDWLVRRPRLANVIRSVFLIFTVVWLGFLVGVQLSVIDVLSFANALLTEFRWEQFLAKPLVFILWFSVAAALLFWGRGPFCGWLCPFGALQEILNKSARRLGVPQLVVPWVVHERLWPIKYVLFLGLFGLTLGSLGLAKDFAVVEPFGTVFPLSFRHGSIFVAYAAALLFVGLFVERFFCRYLCPLGAALAIPGRMRMFEWLRRYPECGRSCDRCARECMVGAIHPDGKINPNECMYCLYCQQLYYDDHECPVAIEKRERIERRLRRQSKSVSSQHEVGLQTAGRSEPARGHAGTGKGSGGR
jgi:NosR/NirI family nitrous oxide reductase transcriptional regulator